MKMRFLFLFVLAGSVLSATGCQGTGDYIPGWTPDSVNLSRLDTASVIRLYTREDPELERQAIGGRDPRIVWAAQNELDRRLSKTGSAGLTAAEREQLTEAIRTNLESRPDLLPTWRFLMDHAPEVVLEALAKSDRVSVYCPVEGWKALYSSRPQETLTALKKTLLRSRGLRLAGILNKVGEAGITEAGDLLYEYTRHRQWYARAGAMLGLDELKDPRVAEALVRNVKGLDDGPDLLTWVFDPMRASVRQYYQVELIRAVQRNEVHEAEGILESMALNAWSGKSLARVSAGEALAVLNRPRAVAVTQKLLKSWSSTERTVGAMIVEYARLDVAAPEPLPEQPLHDAARKGNIELVRSLLKAHPDRVDARGEQGKTPLHSTKDKDTAELLIAKGADVNARDKDGGTPLHLEQFTFGCRHGR